MRDVLKQDQRSFALLRMTTKKNKIIIITGQTATGKSKLALDFAQKYNGELINCDSRQIYKYLNIITGKDIKKSSKVKSQKSKLQLKTQKFSILQKINSFDIGYYPFTTTYNDLRLFSTKIWLYDIVNPNQYFSSFDYQQSALYLIKKLLDEGKTPIIVGGTYFYLYHLLYKVETEHIPPNWKLRKQLEYKSVKQLQKILTRQSIQLIKQLNQSELNNPQRLIRKIEIESFRHSLKNKVALEPVRLRVHQPAEGEPRRLNEKLAKKFCANNLKITFIGLKFKDKDQLRKTIEKRVEKRLKQGAIEEVQKILKMGYKSTDPGLKTIGYQQIIGHLKGVLSKDEAIQQWINKEIQYAKRQYTFMKKDRNIHWKEI